jgi:hypothetical protein
MKEKLMNFIKWIFRIPRHDCMTCMYGDFGYESGPCRGCDRSTNFIHYKEEK